MTVFGRVLRTGLSSLRDRAASRLAALRFNPSRGLGLNDDFGPEHEAAVQRIIESVKPPK